MNTQKNIIDLLKEILIIIKRNIISLIYFVGVSLIIGFIYSTWTQDNSYTATASISVPQTVTDTQKDTILTSIKSADFAEVVIFELNGEYSQLPNGKEFDSTFVRQGIDASYAANSSTIVITFNSNFKELTMETVNIAVTQFVDYGNMKFTFVNNSIQVLTTASTVNYNGQSPVIIYGVALLSGLVIGSLIIVYTDFQSGKILFLSDIIYLGYKIFDINIVRFPKNGTSQNTSQITKKIIKMQNTLESNIIGRNLKTIAFVSFDYPTRNDDFIDLMAKTYAQNNLKTLIIDLDFSKPTLNAKYSLSNKFNIVDIVENDIKEIEYFQIDTHLFFLAGKEINYSSRFFKSEKFKCAIDMISKDFDVVLLRLSQVQEDDANLGALDKFDFLVASIAVNKTNKSEILTYLETIKNNNYTNVVFNNLE